MRRTRNAPKWCRVCVIMVQAHSFGAVIISEEEIQK